MNTTTGICGFKFQITNSNPTEVALFKVLDSASSSMDRRDNNKKRDGGGSTAKSIGADVAAGVAIEAIMEVVTALVKEIDSLITGNDGACSLLASSALAMTALTALNAF